MASNELSGSWCMRDDASQRKAVYPRRHRTGEWPAPPTPREMTVRTLSLLAMVDAVAGACTADRNAGSAGDTSSVAPPAATPAADTVTTPDSAPSASAWTVTPSGIGPIRVGMTLEDLKRVGGDVTVPAGNGDCV